MEEKKLCKYCKRTNVCTPKEKQLRYGDWSEWACPKYQDGKRFQIILQGIKAKND